MCCHKYNIKVINFPGKKSLNNASSRITLTFNVFNQQLINPLFFIKTTQTNINFLQRYKSLTFYSSTVTYSVHVTPSTYTAPITTTSTKCALDQYNSVDVPLYSVRFYLCAAKFLPFLCSHSFTSS